MKNVLLFSILSCSLLSGCGQSGGDSAGDLLNDSPTAPDHKADENGVKLVQIKPNPKNNMPVYFDLVEGKRYEDKPENGNWHLAINTKTILTNPAYKGGEAMQTAFISQPDGFYDAQGTAQPLRFAGATAQREYQNFVDTGIDNDVQYIEDQFSPAIESFYWQRNHQQFPNVEVNPDVWWAIYSTEVESTHATPKFGMKFHVTSFDFISADKYITIEGQSQSKEQSRFANPLKKLTFSWSEENAKFCINIGTLQRVDCQSSEWHMVFQAAPQKADFWLGHPKSAVAKVSKEGIGVTRLIHHYSKYESVNPGKDSQYPINYVGAQDSLKSSFNAPSWYWYTGFQSENSIVPGHHLLSNYSIYALKTKDAIYKIQPTSLYDETGQLGPVTIRYQKVADLKDE